MKFSAFVIECEIIENGKRMVEQQVINVEEPMEIEQAKKSFNNKYSITKETKVIRGMNEDQYKEYQKENKGGKGHDEECDHKSINPIRAVESKRLPNLEQFLNLK